MRISKNNNQNKVNLLIENEMRFHEPANVLIINISDDIVTDLIDNAQCGKYKASGFLFFFKFSQFKDNLF